MLQKSFMEHNNTLITKSTSSISRRDFIGGSLSTTALIALASSYTACTKPWSVLGFASKDSKEKAMALEMFRKELAKKPVYGWDDLKALNYHTQSGRSLRDIYKAMQKDDNLLNAYGVSKTSMIGRHTLEDAKTLYSKLNDQGVFSNIDSKLDFQLLISTAFNQLWSLAEGFRGGSTFYQKIGLNPAAVKKKIYSSILYYGEKEINSTGGRFHYSAFAVPLRTISVYFCFYDDMLLVEKKQTNDKQFMDVNKMLRELSFQAWSQPLREDATDKNIVSEERFRKHVWWVGGNALCYRRVLEAAAVMNSVPMVDVITTVAIKSLSMVSQTTIDRAFWTEGVTADGAGWGHGRQCLVWRYPSDGMWGVFNIFEQLQKTLWIKKLTEERLAVFISYLRGSSWFHYRGFIPPAVDRENANYDELYKTIPTLVLIEKLQALKAYFKLEHQKEIEKFKNEALTNNHIEMDGYAPGQYSGTRYFYNNEVLIRKTKQSYVFINTASSKVNGLEQAIGRTSRYNMYKADGLTYFMRRGDDAKDAMGASLITSTPGVTCKMAADDSIKTSTDWRGFNSKHPFGVGISYGGDNASIAFIYEKQTKPKFKSPVLYGVYAHKSYFVFGEYVLCLGSGITNKIKDEGNYPVCTTIEQCVRRGSSNVLRTNDASVKTSYPLATDKQKIMLKKSGKTTDNELLWVQNQQGFAYAILSNQTPSSVELLLEKRPTKWNFLAYSNKSIKNIPTHQPMMHLYINHGSTPVDDTYGYIVYLGEKNANKVFATSPLRVLSNTKDVQAAITTDFSVMQAIFYNADAELKMDNERVKVSAPCALMWEQSNTSITICTADALMNPKLKSIKVSFTTKLAIKGIKKRGEFYEVNVPLPTDLYVGKAASLTMPLA